MSLIDIRDLTFAYEGSYDPVFEHVSFRLDTDWRLGLTGRNGRGKTTLLRLLMGRYEYAGRISSSVAFDYFPFDVPDPAADALTVVEQLCPDYVYWELSRELSLLEVDDQVLFRPFRTLSNGEQTKLLLAALFLKENRFLLIDEPTNHLDLRGRALVSAYLARKKGFLLVSHDRAFLDGCVDHILAINRSNIEIVQGSFSSWYENKRLREQGEQAENDRLKREIKRLEQTAREKATWSDRVEQTKYATKNSGLRPDRGYIGHKAAKTMRRAKAIEGRQQAAVGAKSALLKNLETAEALKLSQPVYHAARLATLRDVSIAYGETAVCRHVSFTVDQGDRIALTGRNGSGKSSLLKLICGQDIPFTGEFQRGSRLKISYVSQETAFLRGSLRDYAAAAGVDETLFRAILCKLDFSRVQLETPLEALSGGQKKKVLLAGSLCEQAHLLVWDEPLNFVDVLSRMQLEQLLLSYRPTILFVEHDRSFCRSVATKTVEL